MAYKDRQATEAVSDWICNDGDYYGEALALAGEDDHAGLEDLEAFLKDTLRGAPEGSAAWHTWAELSFNDLEYRIDWREIADSLTSE